WLVRIFWVSHGETCLEHNLGDQDCLFKNEQLLSALPLECHDARVAFLTPKFVPPQKMACVVHLAGKQLKALIFDWREIGHMECPEDGGVEALQVVATRTPKGKSDTWSVQGMGEWRPCKWWLQGHLSGIGAKHSLVILTTTDYYGVSASYTKLRVYPQAVDHVTPDKCWNILHVAISHRQLEIFHLVKKMDIPMARLVRRIDEDQCTILHHVGIMKYYKGGTLPGPVLQLQEELQWFERVQRIIPSHYEMYRCKIKDTPAPAKIAQTHHTDEATETPNP
ncbi:o-fucosyltransferase 13, partial [Quercus suber]